LKDERITFAEQNIFSSLNNGILPSCFPYQLQIDLTRFCGKWFSHKAKGNMPKDCQGCACPVKNDESIPYNLLERFLNVFQKYGGKSVYLTGGGEPGNYPRIRDFLHYFSNLQLELQVNTNGTFIDYLNESETIEKIFSEKKGQPIINISIHDSEAYKAITRLAELRSKERFYLTIRSTFMIHGDTAIREIENFIISSANAGADIATVRPYYILKQGKRTYVKNKAAFEAVNRIINEWSGLIRIQAPKIDRLDGADSTEENQSETNMPLCVAPLIAIHCNTDTASGMCCDTKETGLAGTDTFFINNSIPENPQEYYLSTLCGIVTLNRNCCVRQCGFTEYNALLKERGEYTSLYAMLTELRKDYFLSKIDIPAVRNKLISIFDKEVK
jgi:hypothetical protein